MCGIYTIVVVRMLCYKYNQVLCMHLSYSGSYVGYTLCGLYTSQQPAQVHWVSCSDI